MKEKVEAVECYEKRIKQLEAENTELKKEKTESIGLEEFQVAVNHAEDLIKENAELKEKVECFKKAGRFFKELSDKQESLPPEINKLIDDNFWELLA